nr:hypothetical protein [Tanacetum cinerariifolium]GFC70519.1 hypothetical protein [Tanacetum cinerariifolium]
LPGQGKGTTADANGRFALPLPGPTKLQIRSLGYEIASVQSPVGNEELTVLLAPAAYALDEGSETLYVISFAANQANHRSTGTYLAGVYQGRLLVQKRDYAVLHYEALWQLDTANYNSVARKSLGKSNLVAQIYTEVFSADRSTHVVDYHKGENGHYYARRSVGVTQTTGRALRSRQPFYYQSLVEQFFRPLPEAGPAPTPPVKGAPRPPEV